MVWQRRNEKIIFSLPEDHAFMAFCQPLGLEKKVIYRRDGGAMVRLLDVPGTIAQITSLRDFDPGEVDSFVIQTDLGGVRINWKNNNCEALDSGEAKPNVFMPQWALAQLVYGYQSPGALAASGAIKGAAEELDLLAKMFPVKPHFLYYVDRL